MRVLKEQAVEDGSKSTKLRFKEKFCLNK